jgi:DNA-binding transcriptional LysR family regulator
MLEMRRVRLLVELERRGSVAAAAEVLHLSPSGVSAQLARLEREVGVDLVARVGRGLQLTEAGHRLAQRGREVLAAMESAESELRELSGDVTGTLRLAAFQSAALLLVPQALQCAESYPGLRVELVQAEPEVAVPALLAGLVDLVIAEEYPGVQHWIPAETHREGLGVDPLYVVLDESLAKGRSLAAAGGRIPWVMEVQGSAAREWAEQTCRRLGFEPDVRYESDDLLVHLELIQHGRAAGMLPALVASRGARQLQRTPTGSARSLLTLSRSGTERNPGLRVVRNSLQTALRHLDPARSLPDHRK